MRRSLALAACVVACAGCSEEKAATEAPRREHSLRWFRDFPLTEVGGDGAVLHVDAEGGAWAAVPGVSQPGGAARLLHRRPGGSWREVYRGPWATELSLSSARAGEVFLGFNQPLDGYRPTLLRVTDERVESIPAPAERLDEREWVQVGAYAIFGGGGGWACGQRGRMWRRVDGAWTPAPPVLPWAPGDPANASYCMSLVMHGEDRGFLADMQGVGATFDGTSWRPLPPGPVVVVPASGLATRDREIFRFDGAAWRAIEGGTIPTPWRDYATNVPMVFDERGRWGVHGGGVLDLGEPGRARTIASELHFGARAIAFADGALRAIGPDGLWSATEERVPTFAPAPPGAIPAGIAFTIAVDLDGDGQDDLVGLSPRGGDTLGEASVSAWLADGRGHFVPTSLGIASKLDRWRDRFDAGDLDGDGDVDLVLATAEGRVEVWRHEGDRFSLFWSGAHPGATVALVDVDADGDLDLSVVPAPAGVLLNDGVGHFATSRPIPYPPRFVVERATWGDLDDDGLPDAVLQLWRDHARVVHNRGASFELAEAPFSAEGAAIEDVDRSGRLALLGQTLHVRDVALPFSRCVLEAPFRCGDDARTEIPAGVFVDLDLDGRRDVIVSDLRGDEHMPDEGEVRLARDGRWMPATWATGSLPQPTPIDADGDGDFDVYSTTLGLRMNTANPTSFLRVRPRASTSDRLASGARVVVRDAATRAIVATARSERGHATLGVPDASARYDVEVRFPGGERARVTSLAAGADVEVRDLPRVRRELRIAKTYALGTLTLARTRDLAPLALALLALGALRKRLPAGLSALRVGVLVLSLDALALGVALRAGGLFAWLPLPSALALAIAIDGAIAATLRRRAARRAGSYLLLEKLGEGAAATVWRAKSGRSEVALKLFDAGSMSVAESRERFFREARVGGEISHPNVVKIRDSGQLPDGRCYLAMELVKGRSLASALAAGKLAPARAAAIGRDVAEALAALHDAGVIHRDVKPDNVMLRDDGVAVLTDLGLARSTLFRTMTRHDVAVGTLAYMSPEQCIGRPLEGATDLWSLGATLYEMVTGRRPFVAEHELELVYVIHNVDPEPPSKLAPGVPAALETAILRCLERAPERRYASAKALADALRPLTDG